MRECEPPSSSNSQGDRRDATREAGFASARHSWWGRSAGPGWGWARRTAKPTEDPDPQLQARERAQPLDERGQRTLVPGVRVGARRAREDRGELGGVVDSWPIRVVPRRLPERARHEDVDRRADPLLRRVPHVDADMPAEIAKDREREDIERAVVIGAGARELERLPAIRGDLRRGAP